MNSIRFDETENYSIGQYIAALRVWRNKDNEDFLIMNRNDVIELLREIDSR